MSVNYKGKVTASALYIRDDHNLEGKKLGLLYRGQEINITDTYGDWVYHDKGGWSATTDANHDKLIEITDYGTTTTQKQETIEEHVHQEEDQSTFSTGLGYEDNNTTDEAAAMMVKSARGIHGMPYQYMDTVDRRIGNSIFGRTYASKIVANMPLLLLTPGKPKFMKGYNADDKKSVLKSLVGKDDSTLNELLESKNGRFYSFEFNYNEYYKIVNPMCRKLSRLMNVDGEKLDGTSLIDYDWSNFANTAFKGFISSKESVAFYIDSETQIQETFSNGTTESQLSNKANSMSDMARELQFVMGYGGAEFDKLKQDNYDASLQELSSFTDKFSSLLPNGLMDKLQNGFLTVASGGKMIFPEIWNESQFSRSYSVTVKLRSPDADKYSIYMNIMVPLLHLIALAAPQQLGPNGYKSPFLIRGYYKGFFNVDMGIITSLSISKGDKGKWTVDGLPTEMDVTLDIKDLYQMLTVTAEDKIVDSLANTALLDYLANLCGININKVDIARSIDIYYSSIKNGFESKVTGNQFLAAEQYISNVAASIFRR